MPLVTPLESFSSGDYASTKDGGPHPCRECGKTFNQKRNLRVHLRTHTGEKPFSCNECTRSFYSKGHLKDHMKEVHQEGITFKSEVPQVAPVASYSSRDYASTGEGEPYPCSQCGKTFNQKRNLRVHMRTHTGEKPYACSECSKSFFSRGHLKEHMKVHLEGFTFNCKVCARPFNQKRNLKTHMLRLGHSL